jgi:hypothetical protein
MCGDGVGEVWRWADMRPPLAAPRGWVVAIYHVVPGVDVGAQGEELAQEAEQVALCRVVESSFAILRGGAEGRRRWEGVGRRQDWSIPRGSWQGLTPLHAHATR